MFWIFQKSTWNTLEFETIIFFNLLTNHAVSVYNGLTIIIKIQYYWWWHDTFDTLCYQKVWYHVSISASDQVGTVLRWAARFLSISPPLQPTIPTVILQCLDCPPTHFDASDEKLVLLLFPDFPSPPDYYSWYWVSQHLRCCECAVKIVWNPRYYTTLYSVTWCFELSADSEIVVF